jgi:hypothetical protein
MLLSFALAAFALLTGCAGLGLGGGGSAGSGAIVSETESARMELRLPARASLVHDRNTADVYLTDLSPATLDRLGEGSLTPEISGVLVHVHIFLNPKPGRTPIEPTAASATARIVVISRGQVGIYDAAGFLMPGRSLRRGFAAGTLRNAPTRLSRRTEGFNDLLGVARTELGFSARADDETAERIARVIRTLALVAEPVE